MRIGLLQLNPTIGDLQGNAARIVEAAEQARAAGARLAICPELGVCGYPPRDLLDRPDFVERAGDALTRLARKLPADLPTIVGSVDAVVSPAGKSLFNAAALLRAGRVQVIAHKRLLPSYDVFDEDRYFDKGERSAVVEVDGTRFGITICEDAWNDVDTPFRRSYSDNPVADCIAQGADVVINIAASPFTLRKHKVRPQMLSRVAASHGRPLVFVNQVGGNDELIFDGCSCVFGADGSTWARARSFEEDILISELGPGGPLAETCESYSGAALAALTVGTRDYARKCGFEKAVLGLSGGVDSALVACIATRALGPQNVLAVAMPTRYSSAGSLRDAEALAGALRITLHTVAIDTVFQSYIDALGPELEALGPAPDEDTTYENLQARIRCAVLMGISNRFGHLVLNTGNKSESAVGYCTLYGDASGALAVIGDLTKTLVYDVAREVNRQAGNDIIPESILNKAPSAELKPDQTDQDSLPPYELLDAILHRLVEQSQSTADIVADGFHAETVGRVARMVFVNEYKRRQMPPALIITDKAFGPGRRYPIAQRYRG